MFAMDKVCGLFHIAEYKIGGILAESSGYSLAFKQRNFLVEIK